MTDLGMNERAWALADQAIARAAEWRLAVDTLPGGARVIDAGINVPGGFAAGQLLAHLCMGGVGHLAYVPLTIGGETYPGVQVWTDHPALACMASQYAGWQINPEGFFAMGSGPLRCQGPRRAGAVQRPRLRGERQPWRAGPGRVHPAGRSRCRVGGGEGRHIAGRPDLRHRADRKRGRRRAGGGPRDRDRPAQDGNARLRRHPCRQCDGHRAAAADRQERHARHWPHQRLRALRRPGPLHRAGHRRRTRACRDGAAGIAHRRITARRSTKSSSATTTTSTRSTRCCSAPPKCG